MKPLAVYTDYDDLDPTPGVKALTALGFEVLVLHTRDPEILLKKASPVTALLTSYFKVTKPLIDNLPNLKIISQLGQGVDNIDVDYATRKGIWVSNVKDVASTEVAEHAWALIYALVRQLKFFINSTPHNWLERPKVLPQRLAEKTLGLVGIGHIGTKIAQRAAGHVSQTLCFDFTQRENAVPPGVERCATLDELMSRSDIVSVQMPLRDKTHHIIDASALEKMPKGSFLVNVGRGPLVDSVAAITALENDTLAGFASDVFDGDPPDARDPLFHHSQIITTPHIAYLSESSQRGYIRTQYENIEHWFTTGKPMNPVNPLYVP